MIGKIIGGIFGSNPEPATPMEKIQPGGKIANKYEVIKKLGEGGFGETFIVRDLTKNIPVMYVAKLQKLTDNHQVNKCLLERFAKEAQMLQELGNSHGQIPSLFDFFEFGGNFYLIQEYVKGKTLVDELIERVNKGNNFSEKEVIEMTLSILEVLERVHRAKVIHRDIKPNNIILREGDGKPVLIDFGIIKDAAVSNLAQTGTIIGTPGFCAPEQSVGKTQFQSDLYAVGMVVLVLLTGIPAHEFRVVDKNGKLELDLNPVRNKISQGLLQWLTKALSIFVAERYSSAQEMRNALLNLSSAPPRASEKSPPKQVSSPVNGEHQNKKLAPEKPSKSPLFSSHKSPLLSSSPTGANEHYLTLRLRTKDDLKILKNAGKSESWRVSKDKEALIKKVEIYNFDCTQVLRADYFPEGSSRLSDAKTKDGRLVVAFKNPRIEILNTPFSWSGKNPVSYYEIEG